MDDAGEDRWGEHDFTWEGLARRCRSGSLPPSFIAAYGTYLRAAQAANQSEIESILHERSSGTKPPVSAFRWPRP